MINAWIWVIICPLVAYLIGSIPFSFLIAKLFTGKDLTKVGTKNVGGLNTMITAGFWQGFLAGFLDFSKGLVCFITVLNIEFDDSYTGTLNIPNWTIPDLDAVIYILVATFVVLGHNYSIYLKFKGGRGLGTSAGLLVVANPLALVIYVIIIAILIPATKHFRPPILFGLILLVPISFFIPIFPPWILNNGLANGLILGLTILGISIVLFPKYIGPTINMFKGKEMKLSKSEMKLTENDKVNIE